MEHRRKCTITFVDKDIPDDSIDITRVHISDGALHLFHKNGPGAFEEHAGSYPLSSILRWKMNEL